jgi:hypothetical protein
VDEKDIKVAASIMEVDSQDQELEWHEMDAPDLEEIEKIERKGMARRKQMSWNIKKLVRGLLVELVESTPAQAEAVRIMEEVFANSWWRIKVRQVWAWLEDDFELQREV